MPAASTSPTPTPARVRRQRPPPGPPVEVWFWRILPKKGRGEHRTLADHVQYEGWQELGRHRPLSEGRYRVEFRDARCAIVEVRYMNVPDPRSGEKPYFTTGRHRRSQRKVPPARPAWEPRAASPSTPTARPAATRAPTPASAAALRPPVTALPQGMMWRLRNGKWEHFNRTQAVPPNCHPVWLADSKQVVLVYSTTGTWPGHEWGKLSNGTPVLVPLKGARS